MVCMPTGTIAIESAKRQQRELVMKTVATHALAVMAFVLLITNQSLVSGQETVTNADVLTMVRARVSTDLIVKTIENSRSVRFDVQPMTIVGLKQAGVDDRIIEAMLTAAKAFQTTTAPNTAASRPPSTSYEDGYEAGWMYGSQVRGDRYNPGDIILPGSMVQAMTVKLGPVEYDKWEKGYLKGHEDGRRGRPRSPGGNTTGQSGGNNELSALTKAQIAAAKSTHSSERVVGVFHDHSGTQTQGVCEGFIVVLIDRLLFRGNNSRGFESHELDIDFVQVQEVKRNRLPTYRIATFHVRLKDGRNFNFLVPDEPIDDVVAAITAAVGARGK